MQLTKQSGLRRLPYGAMRFPLKTSSSNIPESCVGHYRHWDLWIRIIRESEFHFSRIGLSEKGCSERELCVHLLSLNYHIEQRNKKNENSTLWVGLPVFGAPPNLEGGNEIFFSLFGQHWHSLNRSIFPVPEHIDGLLQRKICGIWISSLSEGAADWKGDTEVGSFREGSFRSRSQNHRS